MLKRKIGFNDWTAKSFPDISKWAIVGSVIWIFLNYQEIEGWSLAQTVGGIFGIFFMVFGVAVFWQYVFIPIRDVYFKMIEREAD